MTSPLREKVRKNVRSEGNIIFNIINTVACFWSSSGSDVLGDAGVLSGSSIAHDYSSEFEVDMTRFVRPQLTRQR